MSPVITPSKFPANRLVRPLVAAAVLIGVSGCQMGGQTAVREPIASSDYSRTSSVVGATARGACFTPDEMVSVRERMMQQEMSVVALQCLYANKQRAYEGLYARFLNKYNGDLSQNARSLGSALSKRRIDFNAFITEMANRSATRSNLDKDFCATGKRALDWSLSPQATKLSQVPPPFDFSTEMGVRACQPAATPAPAPRRS
jgi:hypothetical protein